MRRTTTEQRMVQRARIVLEAAAGKMTKEVAALLQVRPATVSRWRTLSCGPQQPTHAEEAVET